tara:strand:+ start:726 stop:866 length:141 start_codon:yes stop_codon:yes gene_type:complete
LKELALPSVFRRMKEMRRFDKLRTKGEQKTYLAKAEAELVGSEAGA